MSHQALGQKKLGSNADIKGSADHNFRQKKENAPNADHTQSHKNIVMGCKTAEELIAKADELIKGAKTAEKLNSKAPPVKLIEFMVTASPDAFKRHGNPDGMDDDGKMANGKNYFQESLKHFQKIHGKENVISAIIHKDEKTPHMVLYVVPLVMKPEHTVKRSVNVKGAKVDPLTGKKERKLIDVVVPAEKWLSAAHFYGGKKDECIKKMQEMHTRFYQQVGSKFGLDRGLVGSKAKHKTLNQYYKEVAAAVKKLQQPRPVLTKTDKLAAVANIETKNAKAVREYDRALEIVARDRKITAQDAGAALLRNVEQSERDLKSIENQKQSLKAKEKALNEALIKFEKEKAETAQALQKALAQNKELAISNNELLKAQKNTKQKGHEM